MRYAVIGAGGQLGRDLCSRLRGDVVALTRADADLTRAEELKTTLLGLCPDMVINCAAYNHVDKAEIEPAAAFDVNAWGPRTLGRLCAEQDIVLVHFSTDYVFGLDAGRRTFYTETDAPGPVSVYGLSKLCGEYLVRATWHKHFVIRTCGLYGVWGSGGKGGNFVETMLRVAGQGKPLRVVADQTCTPSYTADVADATIPLIESGQYGLYHLTNAGSCTWYEFARGIFQAADINADVTPITTQEYGAPARRPAYSVLGSCAYQNLGFPSLRPWQDAVAAYLSERPQNR
jgi:dTDP-4-dehydrorhamnose reductase